MIDTPGLRELQLWDAGAAALDATFADVEELAGELPLRRLHARARARTARCSPPSSPASCASERLHSWRKLQRELRAIAIRHDVHLRKEETRKWKLRAREGRARARQR